MLENRTSDDSGLTSDETSGEHRLPPTSLSLLPSSRREKEANSNSNSSSGMESKQNLIPVVDLMTQSTSALLKRSPRQQRRMNGFPKTNGNLNLKSSLKVEKKENERENRSPSTTDSSPWDEKPKIPIPAPRKKNNNSEVQVILRNSPEKDSLNSYNGEEDYGEYEDDDEIFEEMDSPIQKSTDYVNLNEITKIKISQMSHVYSDIVKIAPEVPKHHPLLKFEEKLFRTAENCLSIVGEGPSTSGEQNGNYLTTPKRIVRVSWVTEYKVIV